MPTDEEVDTMAAAVFRDAQATYAPPALAAPLPALDQLAAALVKAQQVMQGAVKDSTNPHFNAKYADLASIWEACRKPLTDNGLCVIQMPGRSDDGLVTVTTMLLHVSGQRIQSTIGARPVKDDPQAVTSVITYLRKTGLASTVGVAPEDDDGEAAMGRGQPATVALKRAPKPVTPASGEPGKITDGQRVALEAAITECAKAFGQDHAAFRQTVKDKCGTHYSVEHFKDLAPEQFDTVMKWLGQETRKAAKA